jgi:hypothetical protein
LAIYYKDPNTGEWVKQAVSSGGAGIPGTPGEPGEPGKSAYEIAQAGGFEGTEAEWLASLKLTVAEKHESSEPGGYNFYILSDGTQMMIKNGNNGSGSGGGSNVLVVTIDPNTNIASHTGPQIYNHLLAGGRAVLSYYDTIWELSYCHESMACFTLLNAEESLLDQIAILDDGTFDLFSHAYATPDYVTAVLKPLIVTFNSGTSAASHTPQQIYNRVQLGGRVVWANGATLVELSYCSEEYAVFTQIGNGWEACNEITQLLVWEDTCELVTRRLATVD